MLGIKAAFRTRALFLPPDMDNDEASFDQLEKAKNIAVNHKMYETLGITDFCVPPNTIQTLVAFLTLFSNGIVHRGMWKKNQMTVQQLASLDDDIDDTLVGMFTVKEFMIQKDIKTFKEMFKCLMK